MNKFNETYYNMIVEETDILKNSKIKSVIKTVLTGNYRSIKSLSNGYSFEVLVVKPAIIKNEPKHTNHTDEFKLTFNVENNTLKLKLSYNNKEAEKDIKLSDENKLKSDVEKFVEKQVSSLRVIKEDKDIVSEGLFGNFFNKNKTNTKNIEQSNSTKEGDVPGILVNNMPIEQWNDILEDMKKAADDCKTKEISDALGMDVLLLKRGKVSNQSEDSQSSYDPKKMTILKSVHPQSFKDMIEDIKKAAEICTDKELKDALKMDLAILKENI